MATLLHQAPATIGLSLSPVYTIIETTNISPGAVNQFVLQFNDPDVDTQFQLLWKGNTVTYTIKLLATGPFEIQTNTIYTPAEYMDIIRDVLLDNSDLTDDFIITRELYGADESIILTYRYMEQLETPEEFDIPITTALEDHVVLAPLLVSEENLSAYIALVTKAEDLSETILMKQEAPFSMKDAKCIFNVAPAFADLKPHLPNTSSLNPLANLQYGIASNAFQKYYLRRAERYGSPPVIQPTTDTGPYWMLHGGVSAVYANTFTEALPAPILCHNYMPTKAEPVPKLVAPDQPDWLYFFTEEELTDVTFGATLYWSDGTTDTWTYPDMDPVTLDARTLYWFQAGVKQTRIHNHPDYNIKELIGYDWEMRSGEEVIRSIYFDVDCSCHPWNLYLLVANGLGGCETIRAKGKTIQGYDVTRETFRSAKWYDYTPADGELGYYFQEGNAQYECSVGWYPDRYVQNLRQMLLGDTWLIDVQNGRFIKVLIETNSMKDKEDDQDLFSLTFQFKVAGYDQAYQNF